MYSIEDVVYETGQHWVMRVPYGFDVYRVGLTHSTRCAVIWYKGDAGLQRAIAEVARREDPAADKAACAAAYSTLTNRKE